MALTENIYNNTEHSSLTSNLATTKKHSKFTPYRTHFDTHISSLVLRSRLKKYDEHQIKAKDSLKRLSHHSHYRWIVVTLGSVILNCNYMQNESDKAFVVIAIDSRGIMRNFEHGNSAY